MKTHKSTAWLIEYETGKKEIAIWNRKTKIKDVVESTRIRVPNTKFTVISVDVGIFKIRRISKFLGYGKKMNYDMEIINPWDDEYNYSNVKINKKPRKELDDIPW